MPAFKTSFILLGLSLFLLGCQEDFPTYATPYDKNANTLQCLHYAVLDKQDKTQLAEAFTLKEDEHCEYRVQLTKYRVGKCNNPAVKSLGSDFNGYVRVEIKKGFSTYYKVQSNYKKDMQAAFERVLTKIKQDLGN